MTEFSISTSEWTTFRTTIEHCVENVRVAAISIRTGRRPRDLAHIQALLAELQALQTAVQRAVRLAARETLTGGVRGDGGGTHNERTLFLRVAQEHVHRLQAICKEL